MTLLALIGLGICVGYATILVPGLARIEFLEPSKRGDDSSTRHARPLVSVVIAARNEAADIGATVTSLLQSDYDPFEVIVVNDRSTDGTGKILDTLAQNSSLVRVVHIETLPEDWLGKSHALFAGAESSRGEWLCFTDADVVFHPDTLRDALQFAQQHRLQHLSLIPELQGTSFAETLFLIITWFFFALNAQPWAVKDPESTRYCGVGAFNLIRRDTYTSIGTHQRLRLELLDDMKLAKLVKTQGFRQDALNARKYLTVRWQRGGLREYVRGIEKNAFAGIEFKLHKLLATTACLLLGDILPFVFVLTLPDTSGWIGLTAVALLGAIHFQIDRHTGNGIGWLPAHPLGSVVMLYSLLRSAGLALSRGAVEWRGTRYPLDKLRQHLL